MFRQIFGVGRLGAFMARIAFVAFVTFVTSVPTYAADWYVSTTGNNATGNGSQANPFRTLAHVLSPANGFVSAGDSVNLIATSANPTFNECEVRLRVRLTLRSAPGYRARIHCDFTLPATLAHLAA
jgi:hypothetical protein